MKEKEFEKALKDLGVTEIESYSLVSNYGYTFYYKGAKYDARHWLNVYGASVDFWTIDSRDVKDTPEELTALANKLNRK